MAAETWSIFSGVLRDSRRSLIYWGLAIAAVTAIYVAFWPSIGEGTDMSAFFENMPQGLAEALRFDQIATPAGYLSSTIYGLLAPLLLLLFAIGAGARLIAGQEEDGTLELELTSPVARRNVLAGRLMALWAGITMLVMVVTVVTGLLVAGLDMGVGVVEILAASTGLLVLVLGFGTLAMMAGAATGRRSVGLAVAAGLAALSYILDGLGSAVGASWMIAVSPFSWYLEPNPLVTGFDPTDLALLAMIPIVGMVGVVWFLRRDLMV